VTIIRPSSKSSISTIALTLFMGILSVYLWRGETQKTKGRSPSPFAFLVWLELLLGESYERRQDILEGTLLGKPADHVDNDNELFRTQGRKHPVFLHQVS